MGFVHIPWYVTTFRGDSFEAAITEFARSAVRYNAKSYEIFRSREDSYKFLQIVEFDDKLDFERYWNGPEFIEFRKKYQSYYQVPVVYTWHDCLTSEHL